MAALAAVVSAQGAIDVVVIPSTDRSAAEVVGPCADVRICIGDRRQHSALGTGHWRFDHCAAVAVARDGKYTVLQSILK